MKVQSLCVLLVLVWGVLVARGEEVRLKNGDVLSVEVVEKEERYWVVSHPILGRLRLSVDDFEVLAVKKEDSTDEDSVHTERRVSIGFDRRKGNTDSSSLNGELFWNRKGGSWEKTVRAQIYYSESDGEMDDRKVYFMARSGYSFGHNLAWYWFGKIEEEHDRFADVKLRSIPSAGIGYWFSGDFPTKAMVEASLGWQITDYYESDDDDVLVCVVSGLIEHKFRTGVVARQLLTIYPSLEEGEYRLRSESSLTLPMRENLSIRLSLLDEYSSDPGRGRKKSDVRFISSLEWSF